MSTDDRNSMDQTESSMARSSSVESELEDWEHEELHRHRRRIVWIVVPGLIGVLTTTVSTIQPAEVAPYWLFLVFQNQIPLVVALLSFVVCGFGAIMMYLETGFSSPLGSPREAPRPAAFVGNKEFEYFRRDVIARIKSLEAHKGTLVDEISPQINEELLDRVKKKIDEKATERYLEEIRSTVKAQDSRENRVGVSKQLENTIRRLQNELYALARRGNLNLTFGCIVAIGGMLLLGYFVLTMTVSDQPNVSGWAFARRFLAQLSLVTVVEVFAYFFLRLYSRSLTEIKYFQNEISTFEAKLVSLRMALDDGDGALIGRILMELVRTERNHILKKGETMAGAGERKTDEVVNSSLVHALLSSLKSSQSKDQ